MPVLRRYAKSGTEPASGFCAEGGNKMNANVNTGLGNVMIDMDVLAKYAGSVAVETSGVVGMAAVSMKDGIAKLLRKENLNRGVNVSINDNKLTIDLHIIIAYGVSISAVADSLVDNVRYRVGDFSGLKVEKVNIYVEGIRVSE